MNTKKAKEIHENINQHEVSRDIKILELDELYIFFKKNSSDVNLDYY